MLDRLLRTALRLAPQRFHHVSRPGGRLTPDRLEAIRRQMKREFGAFAPPVALHSQSPPVLSVVWTMLRETLVVTGAVPRAVKEVIATEVSAANSCPYCVEVHDAVLGALTGNRDDTSRDAAASWARASVRQDTARSAGPPFTARQAPELIGVAVTFQYLNRMVNVLLEASPLPSVVPIVIRKGALRALGQALRRPAVAPHPPGRSTALLPPAELPDDLVWAEPNPAIADAFARASAVFEEAGARSVPPRVRELVVNRLRDWDGHPLGPDGGRLDEALAGLPEQDRAAGRLAWLVALAPYRIDDQVVGQFREAGGDETALVELTAWAAFTAARTAGAWLLNLPSGGVSALDGASQDSVEDAG
ncbi:carboxymuconolactone decarboxylase family protein [Amycolatopsis sp. QT-25]|uniref:carboxymuconolactone decarboxylase family protein n=1 Tax=Amycolatopsis sp. QT-25 TaxID=3034022 RepID=UPI0023EE08AF|nr:carboxymuconolactone decarboxylase family protein [Amycolatopsis sp. QT-25]WET76188.1 carboxymuconolactone decarboxylase family protein [Amycolatopsis sp. QT-25]